MLAKRIIPCLDVKDGRVVKGTNFQGLRDMADPVEMARFYNESGADELVFYDITASAEGRNLFTDILRRVAGEIFIPLTVGGGIRTLEDFDRVLKCGADKVSVNSGAIADPAIIGAAAMAALQQYNFTKAFLGANGIDLVAGFTTPDPEEAAVKACAARRAHEVWFLADDTKFGSIYPAVIAGLQDGSILTNRCPDPRYRQQTLVKEAEA